MKATNIILIVCFGVWGFARAQSQSRALFEVASIKFHPEPITFSSDPAIHGARVTATASTLRDLITSAYHVRYDQISGGPSWVGSDHYDIEAKAEGDAPLTTERVRPMLQALLGERFQLKIRRETRVVPMFALIVTKNGPKLQAVSPDADGRAGGIRAANSILHLTVEKGTMQQLAQWLSGNGAGRPVTDKTGLTGYYSYKLEWTNSSQAVDSDTPSLFVALQEQLGLKLETTKGLSEILIIDHAEKPSAN